MLQRRKLHHEAIAIVNDLNARSDVDVLGSQLVRAQAAVATREAAIIRYSTGVRNAESRLRAIINDPGLQASLNLEMIPVQPLVQDYREPNLIASLERALQSRPEVLVALKEVRAAGVRSSVAKNELLPVLNFVVGTYVYGLQGGADVWTSYTNQYSQGRPSYWTGLQYEKPFGNRAANARMQQRLIEMRQVASQLESTMADIRADVEIAVREVTTTYEEMAAKYHAMHADNREIAYLTDRWRLLPGDQQVAGVVLDNLLSAQERLAEAEFGFVSAQVAYNLSLLSLYRATGELLDYEDIRETVGPGAGGAPILMLDKGNGRLQVRESNSPGAIRAPLPYSDIPIPRIDAPAPEILPNAPRAALPTDGAPPPPLVERTLPRATLRQ